MFSLSFVVSHTDLHNIQNSERVHGEYIFRRIKKLRKLKPTSHVSFTCNLLHFLNDYETREKVGLK